jgi:hypothetical protein
VNDGGILTKHRRRKHLCVLASYLREVLVLGGTQRAVVARTAVESVMDPFGNREELWITLHHQPSRVDANTSRKRKQHREHLGDPAARCCRVDVHDRVSGDMASHLRRYYLEQMTESVEWNHRA